MDPKVLIPLIRREAQDAAESVYKNKSTRAEYNVAEVPYHTHNRVDSAPVAFESLTNKIFYLPFILPGTTAQTSTNYSSIFIVPQTMVLLGVKEVHAVAGSGGTLQVQKLTGTTAPGSGTNMLSTTISLTATANTVQTGVLSTVLTDVQLKAGDRIGLVLSGTPTNLQNLNVVLQLGY